MAEDDRAEKPAADGSQFDVVAKYVDIEPGDIGPSVPQAPDPADPEVEVDGRVARLFWSMVVVVKFALLATTLGLLMIGFDRYPGVGWQLLAAGLVLFVYAGYRYRRSRRRLAEIVGGSDAEDAPGAEDDPNG